MKTFIKISVFLVFAFAYFKRDLLILQYYNLKTNRIVEETLIKSYPNYKKGEIGTLLSYNLGTTEPPYYKQTIFNKGNNRFAFAKFDFNKEFKLTNWKEEPFLQQEKSTHKYNKSHDFNENIALFLAKESLARNEPFSAILILQQALDTLKTSAKIDSLLNKTISLVQK